MQNPNWSGCFDTVQFDIFSQEMVKTKETNQFKVKRKETKSTF